MARRRERYYPRAIARATKSLAMRKRSKTERRRKREREERAVGVGKRRDLGARGGGARWTLGMLRAGRDGERERCQMPRLCCSLPLFLSFCRPFLSLFARSRARCCHTATSSRSYIVSLQLFSILLRRRRGAVRLKLDGRRNKIKVYYTLLLRF